MDIHNFLWLAPGRVGRKDCESFAVPFQTGPLLDMHLQYSFTGGTRLQLPPGKLQVYSASAHRELIIYQTFKGSLAVF